MGALRLSFFANPHLWLEVVHLDDQERVRHYISTVVQEGSIDWEYRILKPDGAVRWVRNRSCLVCDRHQRTCRIDGMVTDITQRKIAEVALHQAVQQNSLLALAISNLATGVIISDATLPDNPVIFANPGFTAITGYASDEIIGRNCRCLQGANTERTTVQAIRQAIADRQPYNCVVLNYRKDGIPFWNELTLNPVFDVAGQLTNFVGLQTDVTARKQAETMLEQLRHQHQLILNSVGEGIYGLDLQGHATFVNPAAARMTGWEAAELIGQSIPGILHQSMSEEILSSWQDAIVGETAGDLSPVEGVFWRKDGSSFWVEYIRKPIREQGELVGMVVTFQDITERKQAEEALKESEERYALAVQGANDGLWDWNLKTNQIYFSPRWKAMLGWGIDEISNSPDEWFTRLHPEELAQVRTALLIHLEGQSAHFEIEHRMQHKDGSFCWVLNRGLAIRDRQGRVSRMAGSLTDITERKQAEAQLLYDAYYDPLTQLPNRALLMDRLEEVANWAQQRHTLFAVLFIDLDRFKGVNDSLGHTRGDQLLIAIAQLLKVCVRQGDTVARLGGDEFAIVLDALQSVTDAISVAERIQQELTLPINLSGCEVFATVSIGIALSGEGNQEPEDLLRDSDIAMYQAKLLGKSRYVIFDAQMRHRAIAQLQLETDLRRAMTAQAFHLEYQPIVCLSRNSIIGFEALLRWRHPLRGAISPGEFIPLAEETGLIVPLGFWALKEACLQMQSWQSQLPTPLPLTISVNLSCKQFSQPNLFENIAQILQETQLDGQFLKLEITESTIMENAEAAPSMLTDLKALGIQLSIDDFGTGYSSLSYLHRFPIDTLKIDRSFISRITTASEPFEIVKTILALAENLGMTVVAEGVETPDQLVQLKMLKCPYAQGYFFSRPVSSAAAQQLILQQCSPTAPSQLSSI
ncbi:EAL domain-containing protein [Neosynechococcus sphagnicola]|uniref:EAL domain-containing protein n=1 Tax=Neosynechococcus sphagnicola TaxID=1501145 RepID=UPI000690122B|nr:EAL domain-containing protein [Neosynechococcus sphagnicola]